MYGGFIDIFVKVIGRLENRCVDALSFLPAGKYVIHVYAGTKFPLTLSIPLCRIGSKLRSSSIPWSIFVTRKCRSHVYSVCVLAVPEWHNAILVVITMSTAPSFGSDVCLVTKRHAGVGLNRVAYAKSLFMIMEADERMVENIIQ